jgi:single-strand DNA-binding protein
VKKGSKLHIEGKLETRKYEKDGSDRYITEIVLHPHTGAIILLDPKAGEHLDDDPQPARPVRDLKPG